MTRPSVERKAEVKRVPVGSGEERWHGTLGGYTNHRCGCDGCSAAHTDYQTRVRSTDEYKQWRRDQVRRWRARRSTR